MNENRDSILYLVDASTSMVSSGALLNALRSINKVIRSSVKTTSNRFDVGILLFNVEGNTKTLLKLGEPSISDIKKFNYMVEHFTPDSIKSIESSPSTMLELIRQAKAAMNSLHTKSYRRVILITNNDDPFKGDSNENAVAKTLIDDLVSSPSVLVPIFVEPPQGQFNLNKFWMDVNLVPSFWSEQPSALAPAVSVSELESRRGEALIVSQSFRKFVNFRGIMVLNKLQIGVVGYYISKPKQKPTSFKLGISTSANGFEKREVLKPESILVKAETGAEISLENAKLTRQFKLSSSKNISQWTVDVDDEDFAQLKNNNRETSSLEISRFVKNEVGINMHRKHGIVGFSLLLVSNDTELENSQLAFDSLHRTMEAKRVAAVATLVTKNYAPHMGLIYSYDPFTSRLQPNTQMGMYFVPLPFIDDIRPVPDRGTLPKSKIPADIESGACAALSKSTNALVQKFMMPGGFDPARFPNPTLDQFAYVLECLALSLPLDHEEGPGGIKKLIEVKDSTKPRYDKIAKLCERLVPVINQQLDFFAAYIEKPPQPPAAKRTKKSDDQEDVTLEMARYAIEMKQLNKWTVPKLKSIAKLIGDTGLVVPSRKNELLNYIETYIN